jgi:hypothetical protein
MNISLKSNPDILRAEKNDLLTQQTTQNANSACCLPCTIHHANRFLLKIILNTHTF